MKSLGLRTAVIVWAFSSFLCFAEGESAPFVKVEETNDKYHVIGKFGVQAPTMTVWKVLSGYERFKVFMSIVKESKVLSRNGDDLMVAQQAQAEIFMVFKVTLAVVLKTHETKYTGIEFEDMSKQDFDLYTGFWNISEEKDSVSVVYDLTAKTKKYIPSIIAMPLLRNGLGRCLTQVKEEILRQVEPGWKPKLKASQTRIAL